MTAILLPYQQRLAEAVAGSSVVVYEKSRRIGATWGLAAVAVLTAGAARQAGGMNVFYVGYNQEMTREFVDTCGEWALAFGVAANAADEILFDDDDPDKAIRAYRIRFASGYAIVALPSRPRGLRGKQGVVIIDEAAFHDELTELLKAALALLMWGGKVVIVSTHNGVASPFNQLLIDARGGRKPYTVLRTTFDDALTDGLYRRICENTGKPWSAEAEMAWVNEIRDIYGDAADEELDCIPRNADGAFLPGWMIEARQVDGIPVLRWTQTNAFAALPVETRRRAAVEWFAERVRPTLAGLPPWPSWVGGDIARSGDLTVFWPVQRAPDMRRHPPCVIELRNVPYEQQQQILFALCDGLPRFTGGAIDATGLGAQLAEATWQRYGSGILRVGVDQSWLAFHREHMPKFRVAFEDDLIRLPRDGEIYDDHRAIQVVSGVAQVPRTRTQGAGGKRHGDAAVAHALAFIASATQQRDYEFLSIRPSDGHGGQRRRELPRPGEDGRLWLRSIGGY